jgi:outer membrane protein OmpA-like peptidoglycan-associated protein
MLFVFILTTFWYANQLAQDRRAVNDQLDTLRRADKKALEIVGSPEAPGALTRCLGRDGEMDAILDPRPQAGEARVSLYLRSAVEWFAEGSAALGEEQKKGVQHIRRCLAELVESEDLKVYRISIFLEGHTDAIPLARGSAFATNWELSAARAAAVLNKLLPDDSNTDPALAPLRVRESTGEVSIVAVGMADRQPAWSRLCEGALPDEITLCAALLSASSLPVETRSEEWKTALTRDIGIFTAYTYDCTPVNQTALATHSPSPTTMELLRAWANRCPLKTGMEVSSARALAQARRALLRRVDLRLELDPIVTPEND